ncbi:MAG: inosine/xanthosine triphosphatase [Anaerolineaceae bacterium]|jgi:inosine/xanthosine triphosphatase|nr:inosine/xanthosine triphosphatase [Anaerolineaceae bacterium]
MKQIIVASKNPVKLEAVRLGFEQLFTDETFDVQGLAVSSGVDDQPFTHEETLQGAVNRVAQARQKCSEADYWVGIEGGVEQVNGELHAFAWVVVRSASLQGKGCTGTFVLPPRVSELVYGGMELGDADDVVFQRSNSKQENGAVGLLTGDVITRTSLYAHAVVLALIPFRNTALYGA